MNIVFEEINTIDARICGCAANGNETIGYVFTSGVHSLFIDKTDILRAELGACEKLLGCVTSAQQKNVVKKEITTLNFALASVK